MADAAAWAGWLIENGLNFSTHAGLLAGALALIALAGRKPRVAAVFGLGLAVALVNGGLARSVERSPASPAPSAPVFTVAAVNVNERNPSFGPLDAYLAARRDMVVALTEFGPWDVGEITPPSGLRAGFTDFNMVLWVPPLAAPVEEVDLGGTARPEVLRSRTTIAGRRVHLFAVHLTRPGTPRYLAMRREEMAALAALVAEIDGPVVVMGDFNATTRSPAFRRFLRASGLKAHDSGFLPPQTTWPAWLPHLGIQIDHVLTKGGVRTISERAGPDIGSNHLPIAATLTLDP
jgi:hypothetical protein